MMEYGFDIHDHDGRKRFVWHLKGPSGGVHIWAQFHKDDERVFGERCYGGVEIHRPQKTYDFQPDEAPIKDCWLIGGDCWPDGSSLYFSEHIQQMVESYEDDPERITDFINAEMLSWYRDNFSRDDCAEAKPEDAA